MSARDIGMVALGYGKYARATDIVTSPRAGASPEDAASSAAADGRLLAPAGRDGRGGGVG